jgi:predicted nuclease of predicted toxin-antitoxin system
MRFLADMGVAQRIVDWLRAGGHDTIHLRDEGLQRMPNGEIFEKAASENRIIWTFDLDFGEILALAGGQRASVILFRLHNTRTSHVIDRLDRILTDSMHALEQGAIVIVQESRHRVRRLAPEPWSSVLRTSLQVRILCRNRPDSSTISFMDFPQMMNNSPAQHIRKQLA